MHYKYRLALVLFLFIGFISVAQVSRPPEPAPDRMPPPPPGLPIDNGIIILFLMALLYGTYKICMFKKQSD